MQHYPKSYRVVTFVDFDLALWYYVHVGRQKPRHENFGSLASEQKQGRATRKRDKIMKRETAIDFIRVDIHSAEKIVAEQKAIRDTFKYGSVDYNIHDASVNYFEGKIEAWKATLELLA